MSAFCLHFCSTHLGHFRCTAELHFLTTLLVFVNMSMTVWGEVCVRLLASIAWVFLAKTSANSVSLNAVRAAVEFLNRGNTKSRSPWPIRAA